MKRTAEENLILKGGADNVDRAPRHQVYVILDNIRSMHNVGAIFRTCDAARVECLFLCGITASPPRSQIDKTALGSTKHVPWKYYKSPIRLIKLLRSRGIRIIAVEQTTDSIDYHRLKADFPVAIVLGNEIDGVSQRVLNLCDMTVEIPMFGHANSLNISTAAGIILYSLI